MCRVAVSGAKHYAKVARPFASQLFQGLLRILVFEVENAGFSEICVMDSSREGFGIRANWDAPN
jgi:hypothetical protein